MVDRILRQRGAHPTRPHVSPRRPRKAPAAENVTHRDDNGERTCDHVRHEQHSRVRGSWQCLAGFTKRGGRISERGRRIACVEEWDPSGDKLQDVREQNERGYLIAAAVSAPARTIQRSAVANSEARGR